MKPLQIGLLVVAGALCGALVMKVAQGPGTPASPVSATVPVETPGAPVSTPAAAPAAAPEIPPAQVAAAIPPAAPPSASAATSPAASAAPAAGVPSGHPSPFAGRPVMKAHPGRAERAAPPPLQHGRPVYVPPHVDPVAPGGRQSAPTVTARVVTAAAKPASSAPSPEIAQAAAPAPPPENSPSPAEQAAPQSAPPASALPPAPSGQENATPPPPQAPPPAPNRVTLNAGLLIPVRLVSGLSSERNQPGDTFQATLARELVVDGFVIAERGARVEGRVISTSAAKTGAASVAVALTWVFLSDGQAVPIQTDPFNRHADQSRLQDAEKVGGAAAAGAAVGAAAGGGKGAAVGAGVGAGVGTAAVLLAHGQATMPPETPLTFRLKIPVTVTERQ